MQSKAKGNKLFQAGKTEEAIRAYSTGIDKVEEGKGSAEDKGCLHLLYANRSMAHLELALVDEALQDAELCIDTNPDFGKGYLRRALVLLDLFKNQDAVLDLDKAEELDPGLAPEGCEARRRAAGEVWVDNCYLKEHKRLKKKLGCDYVVIGEIEESDTKLNPLIKIEDTDRLPVGLTGPWFDDDNLFAKLKQCTTERGVKLDRATGSVSLVLFETLYRLDIPQQIEMFGLNNPFRRLVFAQLKREYGPSHTCQLPTPVASKLGYDSNSMQCFLWHCVDQADRHTTYEPLMFPGAPKWVEFGDAETQIFLEWIRWESEERDKEFFDHLRSHNLPSPAAKPIGEAPPFAMFAEHRQQLKDYRARLEQAEHRCQGCGTEIKDPDPQECLCGAFYCSFLCHAEYKPSHQTECEKTFDELKGPSLWTIWYWRLVQLGYYPFKNEVDPVAAWKSRNIEVDTRNTWTQELSFYQDLDTASRDETRASLVSLLGKPDVNDEDGCRARLLRMKNLPLELTQSCLKCFSTPILTDTPGRIWWKYASYKHKFPLWCEKMPHLDTVDNQVAVIHSRFLVFARARCAPGEKSPAWDKLLKDLTDESFEWPEADQQD